MENDTRISFENICCTCLSVNRKLTNLGEVNEGVNNLFFLLSSDSEAYGEVYGRGAENLYICWECKSLLRRLCKFRDQSCDAQKSLYKIVDGKINIKSVRCLSKLTHCHQSSYDYQFITSSPVVIFSEVNENTLENESDAEYVSLHEISDNESTDFELEDDEDTNQHQEEEKKDMDIKEIVRNITKRMSKEKFNETFVDLYDDFSDCDSNKEFNTISKIDNDIYKKEKLTIDKSKSSRSARTINQIEVNKHTNIDEIFNDIRGFSSNEELESVSKNDKTNRSNINEIYIKENTLNKNEYFSENTAVCEVDTNENLVERKYVCTLCNKFFRTEYERKRHITEVHKVDTTAHTLSLCSNMLTKLLSTTTQGQENNQKENGFDVTKEQTNEQTEENGTESNVLDSECRDEENEPNADLPCWCTTCGRRFKLFSEQLMHKCEPLEPRSHQCDICEESLESSLLLTSHIIQKHYAEKTIFRRTCDTCGHIFANRWRLENHIEQLHPTLDTYVCRICDAVFRDKSNMEWHKATKHKRNPRKRNKDNKDEKPVKIRKSNINTAEKPVIVLTKEDDENQSNELLIDTFKNENTKGSIIVLTNDNNDVVDENELTRTLLENINNYIDRNGAKKPITEVICDDKGVVNEKPPKKPLIEYTDNDINSKKHSGPVIVLNNGKQVKISKRCKKSDSKSDNVGFDETTIEETKDIGSVEETVIDENYYESIPIYEFNQQSDGVNNEGEESSGEYVVYYFDDEKMTVQEICEIDL